MKTLCTILLLCISASLSFSQSADLKYELEKGKTYKVKSTSVQDQTVTMQGMENKSETVSTSYMSMKMLDAKSDFFLAEVRFDTITTKVSAPPMNLSSTEEGDITSGNPIDVTNAILHRLSNSTMVVKFDYSGKVQDIMNHAVIKQTVLEGTDSLSGQAAMAKGQLEMLVEKKSLVGMIESVTAYLPNSKVKTGDSWETTVVMYNGGIGMNISTTYKLKELSKKSALLKGENIIEPASAEPVMMNGAEIVSELRGLGETTAEVDPETGWVIKATSKTQLSGDMKVNAGGQQMTMPVESIITSEVVNVE